MTTNGKFSLFPILAIRLPTRSVSKKGRVKMRSESRDLVSRERLEGKKVRRSRTHPRYIVVRQLGSGIRKMAMWAVGRRRGM
jgi:hypothetical protein